MPLVWHTLAFPSQHYLGFMSYNLNYFGLGVVKMHLSAQRMHSTCLVEIRNILFPFLQFFSSNLSKITKNLARKNYITKKSKDFFLTLWKYSNFLMFSTHYSVAYDITNWYGNFNLWFNFIKLGQLLVHIALYKVFVLKSHRM